MILDLQTQGQSLAGLSACRAQISAPQSAGANEPSFQMRLPTIHIGKVHHLRPARRIDGLQNDELCTTRKSYRRLRTE